MLSFVVTPLRFRQIFAKTFITWAAPENKVILCNIKTISWTSCTNRMISKQQQHHLIHDCILLNGWRKNGVFCTDGVKTSQSWDGWKIIPHCFSVSPVRSWTGDFLRRDFADQKTVTWTADILFSNRSVLYRLQREGHKGEDNKKPKTFSASVSRFY